MVKRIIVMALLVSLVLSTVHAQRARDHIALGREHMAAQRFEEAMASFQAAITLEPRNRDAPPLLNQAKTGRINQLMAQGKVLVEEEKFSEAIETYNLVFNIERNHRETSTLIRQAREEYISQLIAQAQALTREGNFAEAIETYDLAARIPTDSASLRLAISSGGSAAQRGLQQAKEEAARQVVRNANLLFIDYKFTEAIAEYENAISMGGLNQNETSSAQSRITQVRNALEKIESYNKRSLHDNDFEFRQSGNNMIITGYKASERIGSITIDGNEHVLYAGILDLVIPGSLHRNPVTEIAAGAFRDKGLTSVTIPNTVTAIGNGAFADNRLTRVTLGSGVRTIGIHSPISTQEGAFRNNPQLVEIVIPNSVTLIGVNSFANCGLTRVTLGRGVQTIGERAFQNNKISSITLPASLKTIGSGAFRNNQLQTLSIPNGVEVVEQGAFINNPMTEVVIPASLATDIPRHPTPIPRLGSPMMDGISFSCFPDTLTRVTLPANVTNNNLRAFEANLRSFYIDGQNRRAGVYVKDGPVWRRQ